jgi:hypothetical protein
MQLKLFGMGIDRRSVKVGAREKERDRKTDTTHHITRKETIKERA